MYVNVWTTQGYISCLSLRSEERERHSGDQVGESTSRCVVHYTSHPGGHFEQCKAGGHAWREASSYRLADNIIKLYPHCQHLHQPYLCGTCRQEEVAASLVHLVVWPTDGGLSDLLLPCARIAVYEVCGTWVNDCGISSYNYQSLGSLEELRAGHQCSDGDRSSRYGGISACSTWLTRRPSAPLTLMSLCRRSRFGGFCGGCHNCVHL